MINVSEIRERAFHYLTPDVAASAGLTLAELQQFVAGAIKPSNEQLEQLAKRMGVQ